VLNTSTQDHVVVLALDRPHVHNALDRAMVDALAHALAHADADPSVRAVVLTGVGASFCSGDDLREAAAADRDAFRELLAGLQRLTTTLVELGKPVVAAFNGPAYGAGLELALGCDARLATPSFTCATPEVQLGLLATGGASLLLPMLVGPARARRLLLSGATVDAAWCLAAGLVDELVEPDRLLARAVTLARELSAGPAGAVAQTRALLAGRLAAALPDALADEATACLEAHAGWKLAWRA
jgi:enoyl-CoA hydratase/carnithine racemase